MKQILYFSKNNCAPCVTMTPVMNILQTEMSITFINAQHDVETARTWNVRSVPTVLLIENGIERGRLTGVQTKDKIRNLYNG